MMRTTYHAGPRAQDNPLAASAAHACPAIRAPSRHPFATLPFTTCMHERPIRIPWWGSCRYPGLSRFLRYSNPENAE